MSNPYANMPPPPSAGEFPDRFVFNTPGQSVEGVVRDVRMTGKGEYEPCPVLDIQTAQAGADGQPLCWSVFCNPTSLWRQLAEKQPPVGSMVRVTFTGYEGKAKLFTLEVAGGPAQPAPMAAPPQQAPLQAPAQGFPPAEAYAQQPAPAPAPAQPFGTPPAPGTPPPWGQ